MTRAKSRPTATTLKKVVVLLLDGSPVRGYMNGSSLGGFEPIDLLTPDGEHRSVEMNEVKAVYFVREFPEHFEPDRKTFLSRPKLDGLWVRLRFRDFGLESKAAFPAPPPPAAHEIFLHPVEDAVLLTMACGEDGTFVRVARMVHASGATGGKIELVATEGDGGLEPCGLAEATDDGGRVCLVTGDRAELRRWPGMAREAQVDVGEDRAASYNGVRIGGRFVVSATEQEDGEERALVLNDALELEDDAPAPPGMWAGRLGKDRLVTVGREKGEPRRAFVYAIEL